MAKDPKPENGRPSGGASRGGSSGTVRGGSGGAGGKPGGASRAATGGKGRTRPAVDVVSPQRPWGLIIGAVVVVVFAVAAIGYAVVRVNEANEGRITAADQLSGLQTFDYAAGQEHVTTPVTYEQTPPVGGPHDYEWADCTGTVYDVDIRHENAVHSLEHGAVWITYDPELVSDADVDTLAALVDGQSGRMLSPYAGLGTAVSLQSWNQQLKVDSVTDERIEQFADFMTYNRSPYGDDDERNALAFPEPGASCENAAFAADPLVEGEGSTPVGPSDAPTTEDQG